MRRWTGDRFVGVLEVGEVPPLLDHVADKILGVVADAAYLRVGAVEPREVRDFGVNPTREQLREAGFDDDSSEYREALRVMAGEAEDLL